MRVRLLKLYLGARLAAAVLLALLFRRLVRGPDGGVAGRLGIESVLNEALKEFVNFFVVLGVENSRVLVRHYCWSFCLVGPVRL